MSRNEQPTSHSRDNESPERTTRKGFSLRAFFLWAGGLFLLLLVLVVGALAYTAHHPEILRPAIVRAAAAAGYDLSFETLDISFSPPMLEAGGVALAPLSQGIAAHNASTDVSDDVSGEMSADASPEMSLDLSLEKAVCRLDIEGGRETGVWIEYLEVVRPQVVVEIPDGGQEQDEPAEETVAWWKYPALAAKLNVTDGKVTLLRSSLGKIISTTHFTDVHAEMGGVEQSAQASPESRKLTFGMAVAHNGTNGAAEEDRQRAGVLLSGEADVFADGRIAARVAAGNGSVNVLSGGMRLDADFRCAATFSAEGDVLDIQESTLAVPRLDSSMPLGESEKDGTLHLKDMAFGVWADGTVDAAKDAYTLRSGRINLRKGKLSAPFGTADLRLKSDFTLEDDVFKVSSMQAWMQNLVVLIEEGKKKRRLKLDGASFSGDASVNLAKETFSLGKSSLNIGTSLSLTGSAAGSFEEPTRADLTGSVNDAAAVWSLAKPFLPADVRDLSPSGKLPFRVALSGTGKDRTLKASASPNNFGLKLGKQGISVKLTGDADVSGNPAGPLALTSNMGIRGAFEHGAYRLKDVDARVRLSGTTEAPSLDFLEAAIPKGALLKDGKAVPAGKVKVQAGPVVKSDAVWRIENIDISGDTIGRVRGSIALDPDKAEEAKADLRLDDVDIAVLTDILRALGVVPEDTPEIGGRTSLKGNIYDEPRLGRRVSLQADFSGVGLSTADGLYFLGGLEGSLACTAGIEASGPFDVNVSFRAGEILLDTFYLNFNKYALALQMRGDLLDPGEERRVLRNFTAKLDAAGLAVLSLQEGYVEPAGEGHSFGGVLEMTDAQPAGLVKVFVKDPLSFSMPELADLSVDGDAGFRCRFSGSTEAAAENSTVSLLLEGRLTLTEISAAFAPADFAVAGLNLDLPFAYRVGEAEEFFGEVTAGVFSMASLTIPTGSARNLSVPVKLTPNRFTMGDTLTLPLYGGELRLSDLAVDEPFSNDFSAVLSAVARNVDLTQVPTGPVTVEGMVAGDFPKITLKSQRLRAEGGLSGEVFGGAFSAAGFSVEEPFASGRIVRAKSIQVDEMDLEAISAALDIGRITGRMDLSMQNFAFAYGQPLTFSFTAQSVDKKGVPKLVSLKAVNSISVIGTGSGLTGTGVGIFASAFKEFNYKSIGLKCTLVNDVFRVQGLIRKGGVEYLIKRPLLFGINVINRNPENNISFRDMMERVGRVVGRAGDEEGDTEGSQESDFSGKDLGNT